MRKLLIILFGLLLPTIVSAQSVDVEGNVASQVDPDESTVVASPTSIPANGVTVSVITVTLRNSGGTTIPNISVTLTSSRGATDFVGHYEGPTLMVGNTYTSDANGEVRFGTRSSTNGVATYTAVADSLVTLTDKPSVTFGAVLGSGDSRQIDPDASSVTADPTTLPADGLTLTTITVQVIMTNGNSAPDGVTVALTSSRDATDYIGHYDNGELVNGNVFTTREKGFVVFGSRSSTAGFSVYTAVANKTTLTDQPVVTFTAVGGDDEPPGGGGTTSPPTSTLPPVIQKVIDFLKEQATETTSNTLAGIGALTTLALFPAVTTSIITALLQNIPLFNFLLTGWLPIRRRNRWGTVRDRKTGVPVAGVEIELFQVGGSTPVMKHRTDQTGQYGFLVEKTGNYFVSITNPLYLDYKSQPFAISRPAQIIGLDIPLATNVAEQVKQVGKARRYLDWVYYLNYFSLIMVSVGTIVSIYVYSIEPTTISALVLGLYAVIWSVKLFYYIKYRYYGSVVALPNENPLPTAIVQLTGMRQGIQALVHSTISDSRGRFLFIVKPDKYSMIVAKEGYEPAEAEVDEKRIAQTIKLRPSANDEILNRPATTGLSNI